MQLIDLVVRRQSKRVGASVASRESLVEAALAVEGLRDVTNVMDQKTQCVGLLEIWLARVQVLKLLVHV